MNFCSYADINECLSANGGCDHTCTNTEGSFYCTCDNGYELHSDKLTCEGKFLNMYLQFN